MFLKTSWAKPLLFLMAALFVAGCAGTSSELRPSTLVAPAPVLVIGHRGASGYRPEHTLESYQLAIDMGADFIEPDLVITKDGVLIARHENEISGTTDVAAKFPRRKKTKLIDGHPVTGWFAEDFTLKEIKTLRANERLPQRDQSYNGKFSVPTFMEVLELARSQSQKLGKTIGVYPETKHPTFFREINLPLEEALVKDLAKFGWLEKSSPVIIQSFELGSLKRLSTLTKSRLVFLYDEAGARPYDRVVNKDPKTYGDYTKPEELKKLASFLYGIGPWKRLIIPADAAGRLGSPTDLVADAHAAG